MSQGGHSELLLFSALFHRSTPSCLKVGGGGVVVVVAHVILVSALGPNPSFFLYWGTFIQLGACWDKGLDSDLDQGLTIKLKGLDIFLHTSHLCACSRNEVDDFHRVLHVQGLSSFNLGF